MKTAISIPDRLFRQADRLARRLGKSRSQMYSEAVAEYVARRDPAPVTAALDDLLDHLGEERDGWLDEAGRRALERTEWS